MNDMADLEPVQCSDRSTSVATGGVSCFLPLPTLKWGKVHEGTTHMDYA